MPWHFFQSEPCWFANVKYLCKGLYPYACQTSSNDVSVNENCRNRMAELLYGYTEEEALGRNVLDLLVPPKHHDMAIKILSRLMEMGEHWNGHFPLTKKSGETFTAMITNSPLYDDNGTHVGVIGVTNDSRSFSGPMAIEDIHSPVPNKIQEAGSSETKQTQTQTQMQQQTQQNPFTSSLSNLVSLLCLYAGEWIVSRYLLCVLSW